VDEVKEAGIRSMLDEIADAHCRKFKPKGFDFNISLFSDGSQQTLRVNWQAVILKLHQVFFFFSRSPRKSTAHSALDRGQDARVRSREAHGTLSFAFACQRRGAP
jgi:hypothetical protein